MRVAELAASRFEDTWRQGAARRLGVASAGGALSGASLGRLPIASLYGRQDDIPPAVPLSIDGKDERVRLHRSATIPVLFCANMGAKATGVNARLPGRAYPAWLSSMFSSR